MNLDLRIWLKECISVLLLAHLLSGWVLWGHLGSLVVVNTSDSKIKMVDQRLITYSWVELRSVTDRQCLNGSTRGQTRSNVEIRKSCS